MRTLTIKKGNGESPFEPGWKTATVSKAKYGDYNGSKFLDIWFQDFPETLNMRVYAKNGQDGEEFAIGQVFRFANAGLTEHMDSGNGSVTIKLDDTPVNLEGAMLNIYVYKDGKYSRILKQSAPTVFTNAIENFSEEDVAYWKGRAEKYFTDYVADKVEAAPTNLDFPVDTHPGDTSSEGAPF